MRIKYPHWAKLSLVFCLLFGCFLPLSSSATTESLCFTALNDSVLPLTYQTIPVWIDGQLYVPYTVFDQSSTGIALGVHSSYQSSTQLVTVTSSRSTLVFDLANNNSVNQLTGQTLSGKAVLRNGIPYLPVGGVCPWFSLTYSYHSTKHGYLLRICNSSAVLSDSRFIDAAQNLFASSKREYEQAQQNSTPSVDSSTPSVDTVVPVPEEVQTVDTPLVIAVFTEDSSVNFAETLESQGISALFFFTEQDLITEGNLLRSVLGRGHFIGFSLQSHSYTEAKEELARCEALLFQQTRHGTSVISVDSGLVSVLEEEGYFCWTGGQENRFTSATATVNSLSVGTQIAYLSLWQTADTALYLEQLLNLLSQGQFIPQKPLENKL